MAMPGNTYGAAGSEYRTERDTFTKVVANGTQGEGPQSFTAWTKAGLVMEFGGTANARIEHSKVGNDSVRVWAVSKITDSVNPSNAIVFTYHNESGTTGQFYPDEIQYGGNSKVVFKRELRPDPIYAYFSGGEVATDYRIHTVETHVGAEIVRKYLLTYDSAASATDRSRIIRIQETSGDGSTSLLPVDFEWSDIETNTWPYALNPAGKDNSYVGYGMVGGDFNGDGFGDFVWMKRDTDGNTNGGSFYAWFGGLSGSFAVVNLPISTTTYQGYAAHVADFNGDGRADILWDKKLGDGRCWDNEPRIMWWGESTNSFTSQELEFTDGEFDQYKLHIGEFNGDGRADIIWIRALGREGSFLVEDQSWVQHKIWLSNGDGTFAKLNDIVPPAYKGDYQKTLAYLADFNGDGLTDIFWNKTEPDGLTEDEVGTTETRDLWLNRGVTPQGADFEVIPLVHSPGFYQDYLPQIGDLNGDGNADILWHYAYPDGRKKYGFNKQTRIWFMKGDATHRIETVEEFYSFGGFRPYIADMNGDGVGDVLMSEEDEDGRTDGMRHVFLSRGDGEFDLVQNLGGYGGNYGWTLIPMDLNGDGLLDIFWDRYDTHGRSTGTQRAMWFNNLKNGMVIPDLLRKVTDGLGATIEIYPTPITNPYVYQKDTTATYPFVDLRSSLYVTWITETANGNGTENTTGYWYRGAKTHQHGRGFLGFRKFVAWEAATGIWTVSEYLWEDRFTYGLPDLVEGRIAAALPASWETGGNVIKRVNNTWSTVQTVPGEIEYPYTQGTCEEAFDLTSFAATKTACTVQTLDAYGNPTTIASWTGLGSTPDGFSKTTVNEYYAPDLGEWFLGRLKKTTVTAKAPNQQDQVRISSFDYDLGNTGLLTEEIIEPGDPDFELVTTYTHDDYGNVETKTVSGADIESRTTTTLYGTDGKFPETVRNALDQEETRVYDARFGVMESLTGPNGKTTTWEYDGLGRKTKETRPDNTQTTWQYLSCGGPCDPDDLGRYWLITSASGKPPVTTVHDMLGREIQSATFGFENQLIYKDTRYDDLGNVWQVSRNYVQSGTEVWSEFLYDELGRVTLETDPDGSTATTVYDKFCTEVTVEPDGTEPEQVTRRCQNTQDKIVSVKDADDNITTYEYDPFGNLVLTTDALQNETVITYDKRGRKEEMIDPDMGTWSYTYYVSGELKTQTDAKGQVTSMTYDKLGRMETRSDADGTSTWIYDGDGVAPDTWIGKIWKVKGAPGVFEREHLYDEYGRPKEVKTTIDEELFSTQTEYDTASRVKKIIYPGGTFAVEHAYTTYGYLEKVSDFNNPNLTYWEGETADADGNITLETLGNGLQTSRTYNPLSGMIDSINTGGGGATLQDLRYMFDWLGNLRSREDRRNLSSILLETFTYDKLNRLKTTNLSQAGNPVDNNSFDYDEIGNLDYKSDIGDLFYTGIRPHAVVDVTGPNSGDYYGPYTYDANGNMVTGAGRTITWTAFNNVALISKGGVTTSFAYDPDRTRLKAETVDGGVTREILYVSPLFESVRTGANQADRHYIMAGGAAIAVYTNRNYAASDTQYLHRDHLGSVDVISSNAGTEVERFSYDAWGKRRLTNWLPGSLPMPIVPATDVTDQGFTGHEHFDLVGVIHMRGRVYDPTLGRFLSPDTVIQEPYGPQSLNRYSYVLNNPLSHTDPTGHFFKKLLDKAERFLKNYGRQILAVAAAVVISVVTYGALAPTVGSLAAGAIAGAAAGTAAGGIAGGAQGALMGGIFGALSGAAFGAIGNAFGEGGILEALGEAGRVAAHSVAGGTLEEIRGGKFLEGFLAAGTTAAASPYMGEIEVGSALGNDLAQTAMAATVGGTAAVLGGGKFANGAVTASFSHVFNYIAHRSLVEQIPGTLEETSDPLQLAQSGGDASGACTRGIKICGAGSAYSINSGGSRSGGGAGPGRGGGRSTDFLVTPEGSVVTVPTGAQRLDTLKPGVQFQGGAGGPGLDPRVTGVRVMDATKHQGPRVIYNNKHSQPVVPSTGRPAPAADTHIPLK